MRSLIVALTGLFLCLSSAHAQSYEPGADQQFYIYCHEFETVMGILNESPDIEEFVRRTAHKIAEGECRRSIGQTAFVGVIVEFIELYENDWTRSEVWSVFVDGDVGYTLLSPAPVPGSPA